MTIGELSAGQVLGRYELLLPIAQGGMAIVWAARMRGTRGFQKIVAVKAMLPSLCEDVLFEQMFLSEAELAARIRHPNVCEILDLGDEDGSLYIVMEWIDGDSLSVVQKLTRKQGSDLPISVAAKIVHDAALGLHAAHELKDDSGAPLGLVHRDVSPQNILLTSDGLVKVVDFGVAKATGAETSRTRAGLLKGKAAFMSPEQVLGQPFDRRTDVFALGICLYQLITGKHPFRGDSDMATLRQIRELAAPPPSQSNPACPLALDAVVARALEKDPDRRTASMAAFAKELDDVLIESAARGERVEVATFARGVLGARAQKRRAGIRDAIRAVDEKAGRPGTPDQSGAFNSVPGELSGPRPAEVSHVSISADANPSNSGITDLAQLGGGRVGSSTPNVALSNPALVVTGHDAFAPARRRRRIAFGASLLGLVGVAVIAAAVLTKRAAHDEKSAAAPSPTPVEATPPEPVPPPTAAPSSAPLDKAVTPGATSGAASASPRSTAKTARPPHAGAPAPRATTVPQVRDPGF